MKAPSPAFSLYPKDIFGDIHCAAMTHAEFGMYVRLLGHAWLEGSIPAEPVRLQRILKLSSKTFTAAWPAISPCFTPCGDRLVQQRLEEERNRQKVRSLINAERGRKGGKASRNGAPSLPGKKHDAQSEEGSRNDLGAARSDANPAPSTLDATRGLTPSLTEPKPEASLPFPSPFLPPPAREEAAQSQTEDQERATDGLDRLWVDAVAMVNDALAEAATVTGYDGATILSLPVVRPPNGTPITNPASVRPTERGVELLLVTHDKIRGLIASRRGDAVAAAEKRGGSAPSIFDQPAVQEARVA